MGLWPLLNTHVLGVFLGVHCGNVCASSAWYRNTTTVPRVFPLQKVSQQYSHLAQPITCTNTTTALYVQTAMRHERGKTSRHHRPTRPGRWSRWPSNPPPESNCDKLKQRLWFMGPVPQDGIDSPWPTTLRIASCEFSQPAFTRRRLRKLTASHRFMATPPL